MSNHQMLQRKYFDAKQWIYFFCSQKLANVEETKEIAYITSYGVVRLKEKDCDEFHNPDLDTLYYNVILPCLYTLIRYTKREDE